MLELAGNGPHFSFSHGNVIKGNGRKNLADAVAEKYFVCVLKVLAGQYLFKAWQAYFLGPIQNLLPGKAGQNLALVGGSLQYAVVDQEHIADGSFTELPVLIQDDGLGGAAFVGLSQGQKRREIVQGFEMGTVGPLKTGTENLHVDSLAVGLIKRLGQGFGGHQYRWFLVG